MEIAQPDSDPFNSVGSVPAFLVVVLALATFLVSSVFVGHFRCAFRDAVIGHCRAALTKGCLPAAVLK